MQMAMLLMVMDIEKLVEEYRGMQDNLRELKTSKKNFAIKQKQKLIKGGKNV